MPFMGGDLDQLGMATCETLGEVQVSRKMALIPPNNYQ